jgi:hypothetical protein
MQFVYALGFAALVILWVTATRRAIRARTVDTALPPAHVRQIFADAVTGMGWRIVDEGEPLVAQSTILTGPRQRIVLHTGVAHGRTYAAAEVTWYDGRWIGMPRRPWTLQWRMDRFVREVERADPTANVPGGAPSDL